MNLYAYCTNNPVDYCDPSGYYKNPAGEMIGGISRNDWEAYLADITKPIDNSLYNEISKKFSKRAMKNKLRKELADHYGVEYPKYTKEDIEKHAQIKNTKLDANYDLHHIIPRKYGGSNEWWNMVPAKKPVEHQGGIHIGIYRKLFPEG